MFPSYYIGILRSAELTGNLDVVLEQLADYIERDLEADTRDQVGAACTPLVIFVMSIGTVILLVTYVLPKFKTFFKSFHAKLPLPTAHAARASATSSAEYGRHRARRSRSSVAGLPGRVPPDGAGKRSARPVRS